MVRKPYRARAVPGSRKDSTSLRNYATPSGARRIEATFALVQLLITDAIIRFINVLFRTHAVIRASSLGKKISVANRAIQV